MDFPSSVNRLPGLWWIGAKILPEQFRDDLDAIARDCYRRFYKGELSPAQVQRMLASQE